MTRGRIAGGALAILLLLAAFAYLVGSRDGERAPATSPALPAPSSPPRAADSDPATEADQGFLYGRVTTGDGVAYEGRLRWGIDQEAFWGDPFNGVKSENPWLARIPPEQMPSEQRSFEIFGFKLGASEHELEPSRPFMVCFGDLERLDARGDKVHVRLKGGTELDLDRFSSSDFDDGVRVWDAAHGVVDLDSGRIRTIELLPTPSLGAVPDRLHGTVRTRQGEFTGFVGWNRWNLVGTDELDGKTAEGSELRLRFDGIRSIARRTGASAAVTLLDGREIALFGEADVDQDNRGIYVEDERYGRVLISWDAFERVDFTPSGSSGLAYDDFAPGQPLTGSVTTIDGRHLAGRLVYDLDENETIETLDAPSRGVDYTIPFGRIASISPPGSREHGLVTLQSGEELQLEPSGDLGPNHGGMLIFVEGSERPEYVPWRDVERVDFDPAIQQTKRALQRPGGPLLQAARDIRRPR